MNETTTVRQAMLVIATEKLLDALPFFLLYLHSSIFGVWRSPVAHYNGVVGVGSSNLLTPIGETRLEIPLTTASSLVSCHSLKISNYDKIVIGSKTGLFLFL